MNIQCISFRLQEELDPNWNLAGFEWQDNNPDKLNIFVYVLFHIFNVECISHRLQEELDPNWNLAGFEWQGNNPDSRAAPSTYSEFLGSGYLSSDAYESCDETSNHSSVVMVTTEDGGSMPVQVSYYYNLFVIVLKYFSNPYHSFNGIT